jgi:hypothetical protein
MSHYQYVIIAQEPSGALSVRYCNDAHTRQRVLAKHGIQTRYLLDLGQPEHQEECMHTLLDRIEQEELVEFAEVARAEAERVGFVF